MCSKRCKKFLKSVDVYGVPVSMTYKSDPQIKSTVGGFATIFARLIVLGYLALQLKTVLDKVYTLQTSTLKRDLSKDGTIYNLTSENFDFGVRLEYVLEGREPGIQAILDQYIDLVVT
jgi:hypothetical protein